MQQKSIAVFRNLFLSTVNANAASSEAESAMIPMEGNTIVLSVVANNTAGTISANNLKFVLKGSYDGNSAEPVLTISDLTAFGRRNSPQTAWKFPFIKVYVSLAGTDVSALVDVTVALSSQ